MIERLRIWLWILRIYPIYKYRCWMSRARRNRLQIYTSEETIKHIIQTNCSIARFGDGELQMISHYIGGG